MLTSIEPQLLDKKEEEHRKANLAFEKEDEEEILAYLKEGARKKLVVLAQSKKPVKK
ncbi:MAG: hypothetical protein V1819_03095 [bacterium]